MTPAELNDWRLRTYAPHTVELHAEVEASYWLAVETRDDLYDAHEQELDAFRALQRAALEGLMVKQRADQLVHEANVEALQARLTELDETLNTLEAALTTPIGGTTV